VILVGLMITLSAWALSWFLGEAIARLLFGRRSTLVVSATRLPLGVACAVCILEVAGYFLPVRDAAWLLVPAVGFGAVCLAQRVRRGALRRELALVASSFVGLLVGLVPVIQAGRFTAAALTNNDGTYYITAAEWLERVPWRLDFPTWEAVPKAACLIETILHFWHWRTGVPNLIAAISSASGLGSTQALAVVTAVLYACVPSVAIGLARGLGASRGGVRELFVGLIAALAAAPAFLGYQHMTGHLAAYSLFPAGCGAMLAAVRHGGLRRSMHAALLFAAGVAVFADGSAVLVVIAVAAIAASWRRILRSSARTLAAALLTVAIAPFTIFRAARAALGTYELRLPSPKPFFPQRGWLSRKPLDDLATLTGVDPWPPWPAPWPPVTETLVTWLGGLCGLALLFLGAARLSVRRGERVAASVLAGAVLGGVVLLDVDYLVGKLLLIAAAFAVPLCCVGALAERRVRWIAVPFVGAELFALSSLVAPSRWKVVDHPDHDALVPHLAKLPPGSLVAFDGLGAPADSVLDAQRAHRAALLADLRPLHPGLDGGFYRPICPDADHPDPVPERAYALQRVSSETLTTGRLLAEWGAFRLVEADLSLKNGFVAAWAPTHGWLPAERDAEGRVFRWGERATEGTLRVVAAAPCATLRGDLRVVSGSALVSIQASSEPVFAGTVMVDWTPFETRPFATRDPIVLRFEAVQAAIPPPDPEHAVAVGGLVLQPIVDCGSSVQLEGSSDIATLPIEIEQRVALSLVPGVHAECSQVSMIIAGAENTSLSLTFDSAPPTWRYMTASVETIESPILSWQTSHRVTIAVATAEPPDRRFRLLEAVVAPHPCSD
jgi:hypothetical protein